MRADYTFLKMAGASFLSRLIFFELDHLLQFLGTVPAMFSGPMALSFSGFLVIMVLSQTLRWWYVLIATLTLVLILFVLLNVLNSRATAGWDRYFNIQSKLAIRLQELVAGIDKVKVGLFDDFFRKKLSALRRRASQCLRQVHHSLGMIEFTLTMLPFFFSFGIVACYSTIFRSTIGASSLFTVISMMIAVTVPLRSFSESIKIMRVYLVAYKCTSRYFRAFEDQESSLLCPYDTLKVEKGGLELKDCSFTADTGSSVKTVNDLFAVSESESSFFGFSSSSKKNQSFVLLRSRKKQKTKVIPSEQLQKIKTTTRKKVLNMIKVVIQPGEKVCIIGKEDSGKNYFF